jgi:hypothetical protein
LKRLQNHEKSSVDVGTRSALKMDTTWTHIWMLTSASACSILNFWVFLMVFIKTVVVWCMCSSVGAYWCFGGTCCSHLEVWSVISLELAWSYDQVTEEVVMGPKVLEWRKESCPSQWKRNDRNNTNKGQTSLLSQLGNGIIRKSRCLQGSTALSKRKVELCEKC